VNVPSTPSPASGAQRASGGGVLQVPLVAIAPVCGSRLASGAGSQGREKAAYGGCWGRTGASACPPFGRSPMKTGTRRSSRIRSAFLRRRRRALPWRILNRLADVVRRGSAWPTSPTANPGCEVGRAGLEHPAQASIQASAVVSDTTSPINRWRVPSRTAASCAPSVLFARARHPSGRAICSAARTGRRLRTYSKIDSGQWAVTTTLGMSTISLIRRSTATLASR